MTPHATSPTVSTARRPLAERKTYTYVTTAAAPTTTITVESPDDALLIATDHGC